MKVIKRVSERKLQVMIGCLILFLYGVVFLPEDLLITLIKEDGFFENLTAIFFLLISICFFLLFTNSRYFASHELRRIFYSRSRRYMFLLLAIVFFFGFGEEISWGQRIIGFSTPEAFSERNAQNEFNIHNLELFNVRSVDGELKGTIAKLFTMKQLFLYAFFCFLFVVPMLDMNTVRIRRLLRRYFIPIAPLWLGLLFVFNYAIYRILRITTDAGGDLFFRHSLTEMQEFNFSIILLFIPLTWMFFSENIAPRESN